MQDYSTVIVYRLEDPELQVLDVVLRRHQNQTTQYYMTMVIMQALKVDHPVDSVLPSMCVDVKKSTVYILETAMTFVTIHYVT